MYNKSSISNTAHQQTRPSCALEDVSRSLSELSIQGAKEILSLSPIYQSRNSNFCTSPPDIKRLNQDGGSQSIALRSVPKSLYIQDAFRHSYSTGPSFVLQPRNSKRPSYTDYAWENDLSLSLYFLRYLKGIIHQTDGYKTTVAEYMSMYSCIVAYWKI